ncbi:MAG: hypothetical protein ACI39R_00885 [Lachnospiraceae bacterium]
MKNETMTQIAVCGLHMSGFPLNTQLTDLGASYVKTAHTAPVYKLFVLPTFPEKPGMVKVEKDGTSLEVEIWSLSYEALGRFLTMIPSPLGLGQITLEDGSLTTGFICEPYVIDHAADISAYKGWRYYKCSI